MNIENSKIFSDFINKRIDKSKFEDWVYSNSELELDLGEELYTELLALDYKDKSARVNVEKLVDSSIDYASLHKSEVINLIEQISSKEIPLMEGISNLYKWAELGYLFLCRIGIIGNFNEQGKSIVHVLDSSMNEVQKWDKLNMIEPSFLNELQEIKDKILRGKIVLTGQKEHGQFSMYFKYDEY